MQLLPPTDELQFLLGKEVISVRFEPCGVHFIWWGGGELHVMQDFDHTDQEGGLHQLGAGMWHDPPSLLHRLIQRSVVALEVNDNSLMLRFDDGQILLVHTYPGRGENGLIQLGNDLTDGWIVL